MMDHNYSLVSIISPTYNGDKYLWLFLDSVLQQSYRPIQLIVVNDGSTDTTAEILESYRSRFAECGIEYSFYHQDNKGQAAAINTGLHYFSGDYLMWVDSDDILLPDNVSDKVSFLESHPECGFVLGQGAVVRSDDYQSVVSIMKRNKPAEEDTLFNDLIYERNVIFGPGVVMVRSEAFRESIPTGQIYESREGQNWQLMLPIAYNYQCGYLEKVVFKCVAHDDSHSRHQRSYDELLSRQRNFETLLIETISRIPQMQTNEKKDWIHRITVKHETKILLLARKQKDKKTIRSAKKKIRKNGGQIPPDNTGIKVRILRQVKRFTPKRIAGKIKRMIHHD